MAFQQTRLNVPNMAVDYGPLGALTAGIGQQFAGGLDQGRKLAEREQMRQTLASLGDGPMDADKFSRTGLALLGQNPTAGAALLQYGATMQQRDADRLAQRQASEALLGGGSVPQAGGVSLEGGPRASLINNESGGRWNAQNDAMGAGGMRGHFGRLQFGQARLQEAMNAGAIPQGTTPQQFMASPELQQAAERWHFGDIDRAIQANGFDRLVGQQISGTPVTIDGLRAVAHLGGVQGMKRFVETGGRYNPADVNGTRLSDYFARHGGSSAQPAQVAEAPPMPPRRPMGLGGVDVAMNEAETQRLEAQMAAEQAQPVRMAQVPGIASDAPAPGAAPAQGFQPPGQPQLPPGDPLPNIPTQNLLRFLATPGSANHPMKSQVEATLKARQEWERGAEQRTLDIESKRLANDRARRDLGNQFEPLTSLEDRRAAGIPDDDKRPYQINRATRELKAVGGSQVTVNQQVERAYDQKTGAALAERFNELQAQGRNAGSTLNTLRVMEGLVNNPNFYSGFGGATALQANRILSSLGIKDKEAASPTEVFQSLSNRVVLDGLGGSLGTAISNADRDFIQQTAPNLTNTREGNLAMIELGKAMAQRQQEVAKLAREYASKNGGRIDSGFDDQMAQWSQANPLVTPDLMARINRVTGGTAQGSASPQAGAQQFRDGMTATNPTTGERIQFRGGQWVPMR